MQRIWYGLARDLQESEELRVKSEKFELVPLALAMCRMVFFALRSSVVPRSWPLIGKRNLNSSLFTLRSSLIRLQSYNIFIAVHECFVNFFSNFFSNSTFCCSVAVLQFSRTISHTQKILLYLYINIEINFDFYIIYFGTATLQQCNSFLCNSLLLSAFMFYVKLVVVIES